MRKILFVYEYLGLGGVEVILATRMRALLEEQIQVKAMFMQYAGGKALFTGMDDSLWIPATPFEKVAIVNDYQPDVLVSVDNPMVVQMSKELVPEIKIVYEIHTTYPRSLRAIRNRKFVANINCFIVPSRFQANFVRRLLGKQEKPVMIVPDPLDERFLEPFYKVNKKSKPIVAWVGRLDDVKNWRAFIEIAAGLALQNNQIEFRMIGGLYSPMEVQNALWNLIVKNNLIDRVRWYPTVTPGKMPTLLDEVRESGGCVISTSRIESFGMSTLEAMSRGCSVIVPRGGALEELVGANERGLTYSQGDLKSAIDLTDRLLKDQQLRQTLGEKAKAFAITHTPANTTISFLNVLQTLGF